MDHVCAGARVVAKMGAALGVEGSARARSFTGVGVVAGASAGESGDAGHRLRARAGVLGSVVESRDLGQ